ncbi:hypothetical protein Acal02_02313 [Acinetobacter calcoaceticus]
MAFLGNNLYFRHDYIPQLYIINFKSISNYVITEVKIIFSSDRVHDITLNQTE